MKRLTLVRHAKSSWATATLPDRDRPLAKRGRLDATWLASALAKQLPEPDWLLVSDAQRALATAEALQSAWPALTPHLDNRIYLASAASLLSLLRQLPDDAEHVLLVGHHPGLSELACQLAPELQHWLDQKPSENNGRLEPVLVTAGAVSLTAEVGRWRDFASAPACADALLTPAWGVWFSPRQPARVQAVQQALMKDLESVQQVVGLAWEPAAEDVHFLRTRVKRLRAGFRLLQPLLGASAWRQQDEDLRALAKCYAPLREHDVNQKLYSDRPASRPLRHRLWLQHLPPSVRQQTIEQLRQWATQARQLPAMALPDRQVVADIARSYRRARQACQQATISRAENDLHRWRLLVKRLLLQLELVAPQLPDKRAMRQLQALSDVLGEQHDRELLLQADVDAPAARRSEWAAASADLVRQAFDLSDGLFADKRPRWLVRCFERSGRSAEV